MRKLTLLLGAALMIGTASYAGDAKKDCCKGKKEACCKKGETKACCKKGETKTETKSTGTASKKS